MSPLNLFKSKSITATECRAYLNAQKVQQEKINNLPILVERYSHIFETLVYDNIDRLSKNIKGSRSNTQGQYHYGSAADICTQG